MTWSNGMVEGFVNKVKWIKRSSYGQAGFPLLQRRVLLHPARHEQHIAKMKHWLLNKLEIPRKVRLALHHSSPRMASRELVCGKRSAPDIHSSIRL
jgi:hypothetical protein